jgi:hypothetical protein
VPRPSITSAGRVFNGRKLRIQTGGARLLMGVKPMTRHWLEAFGSPHIRGSGGPEQAAAGLEWIFPLLAKHARVRQDTALGAGPVAPLVVAQTQLHQSAVEPLTKRVAARPLWSVATASACIVESSLDRPSECLVMKHPGKPGNPSVPFDEGPEPDGHWPRPLTPSAPAYSTNGAMAESRRGILEGPGKKQGPDREFTWFPCGQGRRHR